MTEWYLLYLREETILYSGRLSKASLGKDGDVRPDMLLQDVCSTFIPKKKGEQDHCGSVYWLAYRISHSYKV